MPNDPAARLVVAIDALMDKVQAYQESPAALLPGEEAPFRKLDAEVDQLASKAGVRWPPEDPDKMKEHLGFSHIPHARVRAGPAKDLPGIVFIVTEGWKSRLLSMRAAAQSALASPPADDLLPYRFREPNEFIWQARDPIELKPLEFRLLRYCLDNRRAQENEVVHFVWGESASIEPGAVKTTVSRMTTKLTKREIPISMSRKQGWITTTID